MEVTYTVENRSGGGGILLLLLILIAAIAVGLALSHAATKHGADGANVNHCMSGQGDPTWFNPESGYYARFCQLENGRWGVQILQKADDTYNEITAFSGRFAHGIEQYLVDKGYVNLLWR